MRSGTTTTEPAGAAAPGVVAPVDKLSAASLAARPTGLDGALPAGTSSAALVCALDGALPRALVGSLAGALGDWASALGSVSVGIRLAAAKGGAAAGAAAVG